MTINQTLSNFVEPNITLVRYAAEEFNYSVADYLLKPSAFGEKTKIRIFPFPEKHILEHLIWT